MFGNLRLRLIDESRNRRYHRIRTINRESASCVALRTLLSFRSTQGIICLLEVYKGRITALYDTFVFGGS